MGGPEEELGERGVCLTWRKKISGGAGKALSVPLERERTA